MPKLVPYSTGWVSLHLKSIITLYGPIQMTRKITPRCLNNLKTTSSQLKTFTTAGMLGGLYSSQFKTQSDFMIRLRDVVKDCQFKKPDEIVKSLFLTHNQNPKVCEELLKSMKDGNGLNEVLGYARLVEGNQHSEHLSKLYLETVKLTKTAEAIDKKNGKNKKFSSKSKQNAKYRSQSKDKKGCHNCGSKHPPK